MTDERKDYWNSMIAFDCPVSHKRHTILECYNRCDWCTREFRDISEETVGVFAICCADPSGGRDLQSGNRVRSC